jgi:hypothetical protein
VVVVGVGGHYSWLRGCVEGRYLEKVWYRGRLCFDMDSSMPFYGHRLLYFLLDQFRLFDSIKNLTPQDIHRLYIPSNPPTRIRPKSRQQVPHPLVCIPRHHESHAQPYQNRKPTAIPSAPNYYDSKHRK